MMTSSNETFSALLAICAGNSPVPGEFPAQRPVTRSFDVFFDLCPNKWLSKQSLRWWFETPSDSLWRHCNEVHWKAGNQGVSKDRGWRTITAAPKHIQYISYNAPERARYWIFCEIKVRTLPCLYHFHDVYNIHYIGRFYPGNRL